MPKLEGIKGRTRRSRGRLRGSSLRLGLLDRLGLVSRALLVAAISSTVSSLASTSSLMITLLLFEGWLIWAVFDHAELIGVTRGNLFPLPLFPDQGCGTSDLGKVQGHNVLFLAHDLGNAIHGQRELHQDNHGLEVFRDVETGRNYVGQVSVRATLPPSTLFANKALLHRGYSISAPNA